MSESMKLSIMLHTDDYRGDHGTDVLVAHELEENETVEHLAKRLLFQADKGRYVDKIEIRLVKGAKAK